MQQMEVRFAVAAHSGFGHTRRQAEAVARGAASVPGVATDLLDVAALSEDDWATLDRAAAIVFGSPTYMGSPSAAFKAFAEATSEAWGDGMRWKDKLAAGFTNSASMNGDKLSTLHYLFTLSQQHGMLWVGTGMMPSNAKAATRNDINYVASSSGLMTATPSDASADEMVPGDIETAKKFGQRIAQAVGKFAAPAREASDLAFA